MGTTPPPTNDPPSCFHCGNKMSDAEWEAWRQIHRPTEPSTDLAYFCGCHRDAVTGGFGRCAGVRRDGTRCKTMLRYQWYQDVPGQGDLCLECWGRWNLRDQHGKP